MQSYQEFVEEMLKRAEKKGEKPVPNVFKGKKEEIEEITEKINEKIRKGQLRL